MIDFSIDIMVTAAATPTMTTAKSSRNISVQRPPAFAAALRARIESKSCAIYATALQLTPGEGESAPTCAPP